MNKTQNSGSCLCGKITFSVSELLPLVGHCHCNMCQKFHGAAFSTFVEVKNKDINWHNSERYLSSYRAENDTTRKFCRCCGSSLLFESKHNRIAKTVEIALSAFNNIEHVAPNAHIYTESKVKWITINDSLPQFLKYRQ